jgi:hypothetical protein
MSNGVTMSCGGLFKSVADVRVGSTAAAGEARHCAVAQFITAQNCQCYGTPWNPPFNVYKDPNPACNLCKGTGRNGVPQPNWDKAVNTPFGAMNCKGLYHAMAEGIMDSTMCGRTQKMAGDKCCTFKDNNF